VCEEPRDVECIIRTAWKPQMRGMQQVIATEHGNHMTILAMIFDGHERQHVNSPYNDPLVIEQKVDNA